MKITYVRSILLLTLITLFAGPALPAQNIGESKREFFFSNLTGERGGPDAFLINHAAQQSWPASIDNAFRAAMVERARKSFDQVKFKGLSRGRQGVWQTVGPVSEADEFSLEFLEPGNSSGRVTAIAVGKSCSQGNCRLYVGTAGGGVWRTDHALHPSNPGWEHLSNGLDGNNIGALTLDPNDPTGRTLFVGTGESNFNYSSGAGRGVFRSTNGGDSFTKLPTMITDTDVSPDPVDFTLTRGISRVAIEPGDSNTIYVATTTALLGMTSVRGGQATITGGPQAKVGLYRTTDGGSTWQLLFEAPLNTASSSGTPPYIFEILSGVKDVQLDPQDPDTVYMSVADDGIYRSSTALDGDAAFRKVFKIVGTNTSDSVAMFDLTVKDGKTRIYAYNGNGVELAQQALYRVDDADVPATALFDGVSNTAAWLKLTSSSIFDLGAFTSFRLCNEQCVYDLVVASPEGRPDTVYVGGQLTPVLGDSTVRSTDAGASFHSFAVDVQNPPGVPHVDVRAIAFHPSNPDIVFVGSDGGLVRSNGGFGDASGLCTLAGIPDGPVKDFCEAAFADVAEDFVFMNRGLQAMQLYNISADPNRPLKRMMAGTQDNSTQWHDGTESAKNWSKVFGLGDGTSANGFHPTNPDILFASFQSNFFFTHFDGGRGGTLTWTLTSIPILLSGERTDPVGPSGRQFMTFDPSAPDTQYTGFEHVWRTQNNGGDREFLEANCTVRQFFFEGAFNPSCGDWRPLGQNLVAGAFGDRDGGVVVAAERSSGDSGTLWAATSLGRVFVTKNVDNSDPTAVSFTRLDGASTPARFISGIAVDRDNPNRAFVAYSGFSALTPATPGHVFEVVFDPGTGSATFTSLDFNLGDMPVNHIVRDDLTGDLYAATDFGVLALPAGTESWEMAGAGLPEVLTPHLEIHPQKRMLFAATHGLGAWYMNLSRLNGN